MDPAPGQATANANGNSKAGGGASRRCPEGGITPRTPADEREGKTGMGKRQEQLPEPEPGTRPAEYVIVTWASEQLRDRIQSNGKSLYEALHPDDPQVRAPEPELEAEP